MNILITLLCIIALLLLGKLYIHLIIWSTNEPDTKIRPVSRDETLPYKINPKARGIRNPRVVGVARPDGSVEFKRSSSALYGRGGKIEE